MSKTFEPGASRNDRFLAWWRQAAPTVLSAARRLLRATDAALDVTQDIAVLALQRFEEFSDLEAFQRWCITRARWLALDRLRLSHRYITYFETALNDQFALGTIENRPPGEVLDLLKAICTLPPKQRTVIVRTLEGYSADEIAHEIRTTPETARSLRRHAKLKLIEALGEPKGETP